MPAARRPALLQRQSDRGHRGSYGLLPIGKGQAPGTTIGRGASGAGAIAGTVDFAAARGAVFLRTAGFFLAVFFLRADFLVGFFFTTFR